MKSNSWPHIFFAVLLPLFPAPESAFAQTEQQKVTEAIVRSDSLFWVAYNHCDMEQYPAYFTEDVEFYHDKGGLTVGLENLMQTTRDNLCGSDNFRLRREAVEGSVSVYLLKKSDVVYGAIMTGEHRFYVLEKGKNERLDGLAKFTHVWVLRDSTWKMSRVLSYDHGPAPYINRRQGIQLSRTRLDRFVGKYEGPQTGTIIVQREGDLLALQFNKGQKAVLYPETDNRFFMKERDLTFEFVIGTQGEVSKMLVRENGEVVEEAVCSK